MLEQGKIVADGPAQTMVENYRNSVIEAAQADDQESLYRAYVLAMDMTKQGEAPEPALEEQSLRYALNIHPEDINMLQRYTQVLRLQDKLIPLEIEVRLLVLYCEADPSRVDLNQQLANLLEKADDTSLPSQLHYRAKEVLASETAAAS